MAIATGVFKKLSYKKQTALGTIAPAGAGGTAKYLRRVTSTLSLNKATYQSNEILVSQQRRDFRHGVRSVGGSINGELSIGGYQSLIESAVRQVAQTAPTTGAIITVASTSTGAGAGAYTRASGSFFTDGFKRGMVVNSTGWATTGATNNNHYALITNLTALIMTIQMLDKVVVGAKVAGDSVTIVAVGKATWIPASGQSSDYYTFEEFNSVINQSHVYKDCIIGGANFTLPNSGMATVEFPIMGLDMQTGTAEYFTTPAAAATGAILASNNGLLVLNGALVGLITSMNFSINGNYSAPGGVVGSNLDPDIFPGPIDVTGQVTVLFQDGVIRDMFLNETEAALMVVLTGDNSANPGFVAFTMPRVKFGGATVDDGNAALTLTMPFTALENTGSTQDQLTTIMVQDSAFT